MATVRSKEREKQRDPAREEAIRAVQCSLDRRDCGGEQAR